MMCCIVACNEVMLGRYAFGKCDECLGCGLRLKGGGMVEPLICSASWPGVMDASFGQYD